MRIHSLEKKSGEGRKNVTKSSPVATAALATLSKPFMVVNGKKREPDYGSRASLSGTVCGHADSSSGCASEARSAAVKRLVPVSPVTPGRSGESTGLGFGEQLYTDGSKNASPHGDRSLSPDHIEQEPANCSPETAEEKIQRLETPAAGNCTSTSRGSDASTISEISSIVRQRIMITEGHLFEVAARDSGVDGQGSNFDITRGGKTRQDFLPVTGSVRGLLEGDSHQRDSESREAEGKSSSLTSLPGEATEETAASTLRRASVDEVAATLPSAKLSPAGVDGWWAGRLPSVQQGVRTDVVSITIDSKAEGAANQERAPTPSASLKEPRSAIGLASALSRSALSRALQRDCVLTQDGAAGVNGLVLLDQECSSQPAARSATLVRSSTAPPSLPPAAVRIAVDTEELSSSCDSSPSTRRAVSLPSTPLVSSLKGSRLRTGELRVRWAPDVYEPRPSSASHTVGLLSGYRSRRGKGVGSAQGHGRGRRGGEGGKAGKKGGSRGKPTLSGQARSPPSGGGGGGGSAAAQSPKQSPKRGGPAFECAPVLQLSLPDSVSAKLKKCGGGGGGGAGGGQEETGRTAGQLPAGAHSPGGGSLGGAPCPAREGRLELPPNPCTGAGTAESEGWSIVGKGGKKGGGRGGGGSSKSRAASTRDSGGTSPPGHGVDGDGILQVQGGGQTPAGVERDGQREGEEEVGDVVHVNGGTAGADAAGGAAPARAQESSSLEQRPSVREASMLLCSGQRKVQAFLSKPHRLASKGDLALLHAAKAEFQAAVALVSGESASSPPRSPSAPGSLEGGDECVGAEWVAQTSPLVLLGTIRLTWGKACLLLGDDAQARAHFAAVVANVEWKRGFPDEVRQIEAIFESLPSAESRLHREGAKATLVRAMAAVDS